MPRPLPCATGLRRNGWKDDIFLDLDPQRGIAAGERWEGTLHEAANRCEAVLFLVSKAWLASVWCRKELNLAHSLNKRLFGVLIEDLPVGELPRRPHRHLADRALGDGRDHVVLRAVLPITHEEAHVHFSAEGLHALKHGLEEAGLDPKYFAWPPPNDPHRPPYRGLRPLEAEDAGIFFGREGPIVEALDQLRGLRESTPPRLLVILGASGAGKSSFLRAGLFTRLTRDDRNFLPLPVIRPERAAINGDTGLLAALERAFYAVGIPTTRAKLRATVEAGAEELAPLLQALLDEAMPSAPDAEATPKSPTLIVSIDQGEELFRAEGREEAQKLSGSVARAASWRCAGADRSLRDPLRFLWTVAGSADVRRHCQNSVRSQSDAEGLLCGGDQGYRRSGWGNQTPAQDRRRPA